MPLSIGTPPHAGAAPGVDRMIMLMTNEENLREIIAFPKNNSGVIVQLDTTNVTCLSRVPARFNNYPHYLDNVLIKITEIKENNKLIYGYLMRIL